MHQIPKVLYIIFFSVVASDLEARNVYKQC